MLSEKITEALNKQMNLEFQAAHEYMAMAAHCHDLNYDGFADFFIQQAKEERFHGMKIYTFLNDRGRKAIFGAIEAPKTGFDTVLDTFEAALAQEKEVTRQYYDLYDLVREERDYQTMSFLNWFLDEQVEEESMFDTHIGYLKRIQGDANALYLYERELGQREFTEEEA
ncbi:ferritin [Shouchella lonarensis]|uniref:Ferritin n=1 Tax=Shouchella lonarensis TaxID=1464122 RepID=A0A1G6HKR0_9BACI|nr:ferritin [Shouchella lonarensis]SDB94764.1 ferritin [Shouchella lonarensis]